jgi:glucose/arabinose dehydrogenase
VNKLSILMSLAVLELAVGRAGAAPLLQAVQVGSGFASPDFATGAPGDTAHLYVTEQGSGTTASIKILDLNTHAVTNFLTISGVLTGGEDGLLGLAFDPDYVTNQKFYVNLTVPGGTAGISKVVEYQNTVSGPTLVGTVLQFNQPAFNHNGGWLGFSTRSGDDHNLYIATGDGGDANDQGTGHIEPSGNAQSTQTMLGKMLRVHVDPATALYTIPANNPFAGSVDPNVKQEIFDVGLRNPFRNSFDRATGTL